MATIRKRGNRYHLQIRRRGQSITRIFDRLATAKSWIPKIEGDIERHLFRTRLNSHAARFRSCARNDFFRIRIA